MPAFKSSVSIEATPDVVFEYLSDVRNLPRYYDGVTSVEPLGGGAVRLTAERDGTIVATDAWFRVHDGHRRRVEWGTDDSDGYRGWLEVDVEGEVCSVTVEVHSPNGELDAALDRTLYVLKDELER